MGGIKNQARYAGLLYVLVSIPGAFALVYVPSKLIVHGNAAATASNIAASETLFRAGIAANLISQILFLWVALALYDLLKGVNRRQALVMLGLIAVPLPIVLLNELNAMAALLLVRGGGFLQALDQAQREGLAMLFLNLHGRGFGIAEIFWGLWLFPLGLLVYRSGWFPRFLGILLVVSCFAYVAESFAPLILPQFADAISRWTAPLRLGEMVFMLWLLIVGARPRASGADESAPARVGSLGATGASAWPRTSR